MGLKNRKSGAIADPTEMHGTILDRNIGIAHTDGLWFIIVRTPGPLDLPLGAPPAMPVKKGPLSMRIADVLKQDQLMIRTIGGKASIGVLGEPGPARPDGRQCSHGLAGYIAVELKDLRSGTAGIGLWLGCGIGRQKQTAIRKADHRTGLARPF